MSEGESFALLSEITTRMIESQISNTDAISRLNSATEDGNDSLKEICGKLDGIDSHFSNGFRSEIKNHITSEADEVKEALIAASKKELKIQAETSDIFIENTKAIMKKLDKFLDFVKNPWSWIKIIAALMTGMAGLIATIISIVL